MTGGPWEQEAESGPPGLRAQSSDCNRKLAFYSQSHLSPHDLRLHHISSYQQRHQLSKYPRLWEIVLRSTPEVLYGTAGKRANAGDEAQDTNL